MQVQVVSCWLRDPVKCVSYPDCTQCTSVSIPREQYMGKDVCQTPLLIVIAVIMEPEVTVHIHKHKQRSRNVSRKGSHKNNF